MTEHAAYCEALTELGLARIDLPPLDDHPDAVFVEDTAVVFPEVAVVMSPGASSRRGEVRSVEEQLVEYRECATIEPPGMIDGGDVLTIGRQVYVGRTRRTNAAALEQLQDTLDPYGYRVHSIEVKGALHLKTAACALDAHRLLVNPEWVDPARFDVKETLTIPSDEPFAANVLPIHGTVLLPAQHTDTAELLQSHGFPVHPVPFIELAKAEAGVTCCSLLL